LTHVLGETGARPSQAVRLRVRDLITTDPKAPRLMMPKSGKGGTRHRMNCFAALNIGGRGTKSLRGIVARSVVS
jgi:hypothetical protein